MKNDVILNKVGIIERCLKRVVEEYANDPKNLENYTKQDSMILNLQRACEASIGVVMHIIAENKLGLPQSSQVAFSLLEEAGIISTELSKKMQAMVEFRDLVLHTYHEMSLELLVLLKTIWVTFLNSLKQFFVIKQQVTSILVVVDSWGIGTRSLFVKVKMCSN